MAGRVVAVTGASAGVGRAASIAFARRGDFVGLIARSRRGLDEAAADVRAAGGRALPLPADVVDPAALAQAADRIEAELGAIDVWVNAAMVTVFGPVGRISPAEFRRVTEVTYLGAVNGTMTALHRMQSRNRGTIVQVGSALAYRSIPLQAAYCGAKSAIRGFTDSLRCELLHDGSNIRLTMVQLPALDTPQFEWARAYIDRHPQPVPPIYAPELAADAILYAVDHPRREYLVGGSTVLAVTGQKLAPGLLDRYLARTAYEGQQTEEPIGLERPDNLFHPVEGLHAVRGRLADRARRHSFQFAAAKNCRALALAGLAVAGGAALAVLAHGRRPRSPASRAVSARTFGR